MMRLRKTLSRFDGLFVGLLLTLSVSCLLAKYHGTWNLVDWMTDDVLKFNLALIFLFYIWGMCLLDLFIGKPRRREERRLREDDARFSAIRQ